MRIIFVIILIAILIALGTAMYFMLNDQGDRKRTVDALKVRVGLSIFLILLIILSAVMGWVQPHGIHG